MILYGCITFGALTWAQLFWRAEKSLDEAVASLKDDRCGRCAAIVMSGLAASACALCAGTAVWAGLGFLLAAWRSFQ